MLTYCEGNSCARSRICLAPLRSGCSELLAVLFRDGNAVVVGCRAARVFYMVLPVSMASLTGIRISTSNCASLVARC